MAIAGLILGLLSILLPFVPFGIYLSFITMPLGIIFSAIGVAKPNKRAIAIAGLVASIGALCWIIYLFTF